MDQPVEAFVAVPDRHLQRFERQLGAQLGGQRRFTHQLADLITPLRTSIMSRSALLD
jgi:hypothetical protein